MAEYLIQDTTLDAIANAIHNKSGATVPMTPAEMATNIAAIPTGGGGGSPFTVTTTTFVNTTNKQEITHNSGLVYGTDSFAMIVLPTAETQAMLEADTSSTFYIYGLLVLSNFFDFRTTNHAANQVDYNFGEIIVYLRGRGSSGNAQIGLGANPSGNGSVITWTGSSACPIPNGAYNVTIIQGQVS